MKKYSLLVLSWCCLALCAPTPVPQNSSYPELIEKWQKVVRVKGKAREALQRDLAHGALKVVAHGEHFLVVRPAANIGEEAYNAALAKLSRDSRVERIDADHLASPRDDRKDHADPKPAPRPDAKAEPKKDEHPQADDREKNCRLGIRCGDDGVNPIWARHRIGAEMADRLVSDTVGDNDSALPKVTVIDTGFDKKNQEKNLKSASFTTGKGHDAAGDPDVDTDGHGTAVCGMISGEQTGVTRHVHLGFLRVTETNGNGHTADSFLAASIEKACEESDVVNVSWGSLRDEVGDIDITKEDWYKKAVAKGCLVVKAAGNSGVKRGNAKPLPPDSPYLTVGASNLFSAEAQFSSAGEVMAPGEGVFSLLSNRHYYGYETSRNSCPIDPKDEKGPKIGQLNGTSFAAPIVAGIAGQVIAVLNARAQGKLDRKARLPLVRRILVASQEWAKRAGEKPPGVTSLTAVLLARAIPLDQPGITVDDMIKAAKADADVKKRCEQPAEECGDKAKCADKLACVEHLNFKHLACQPPPDGVAEDKTVLPKLFRSYLHLQEPDMVMNLLDRIPAGDPLQETARQEWEKRWQANLGEGTGTLKSYRRALSLLQAAQRSSFYAKVNPAEKLAKILRSYEVRSTFQFPKPLGTDAVQSSVESDAANLFRAFASLPEADQLKMMADPGSLFDEYARDEVRGEQLGFLYYANSRKAELPAKVRADLEARIERFGKELLEDKLKLDTWLTVSDHLPALEMLVAAVPDGFAKLREKFADPKKVEIKENPSALFQMAALSGRVFEGRAAADFLNATIGHPGLQSERSNFLVEAMANRLLKEGTPEMTKGNLRDVLLKNKYIYLPKGMAVPRGTQPSANLKALISDGFYEKFMTARLETAETVLKMKDAAGGRGVISGSTFNLTVALMEDSAWDPKERRAFLTGKGGELLTSVLDKAVDVVTKIDRWSKAWDGERPRNCVNLLRYVLGAQKELRDAGYGDALKKALAPLEADIRRSRTKYDETFVQEFARLQGLGEKF